jgi:hypothetical protein
MDGLTTGPAMGVAMFGFLAVGAIALFSFISVAHWLSTRAEERETKERFALLKLLLEHPGEEGARVLTAWREQEVLSERRSRRQRQVGGGVTFAVGVGLAGMMLALAGAETGVWAIGLIPMLVGITIAVFAYADRETRPTSTS